MKFISVQQANKPTKVNLLFYLSLNRIVVCTKEFSMFNEASKFVSKINLIFIRYTSTHIQYRFVLLFMSFWCLLNKTLKKKNSDTVTTCCEIPTKFIIYQLLSEMEKKNCITFNFSGFMHRISL